MEQYFGLSCRLASIESVGGDSLSTHEQSAMESAAGLAAETKSYMRQVADWHIADIRDCQLQVSYAHHKGHCRGEIRSKR